MIENKPNSIFKMITDVLSNVAEMETTCLLERQKKDIMIAKEIYKGRQLNTTDTSTIFVKIQSITFRINQRQKLLN